MAKVQNSHKITTLRKGAWSPEEDHKLIAYIMNYGIWNWREMPRAAGLLRSGKSCRLRWLNYLRPDIKRGNISREEEETILDLHQKLGNRWSAIAARLPGRTDNEIKNYWHTHLKKRVKNNSVPLTESQLLGAQTSKIEANQMNSSDVYLLILPNSPNSEDSSSVIPVPPPQMSSDNFSSSSSNIPVVQIDKKQTTEESFGAPETRREVLQGIWDQSFPIEGLYMVEDIYGETFTEPGLMVPTSEAWFHRQESVYPFGSYHDASSDFWFNVLMEANMDGI